ncbi:hypothetical protein BJX61DRAFT_53938 [Aspergillus egyptiacus]|nr:hypothetical protein BJX61DRAFT_53938 [Aspergillus egyptiacus]
MMLYGYGSWPFYQKCIRNKCRWHKHKNQGRVPFTASDRYYFLFLSFIIFAAQSQVHGFEDFHFFKALISLPGPFDVSFSSSFSKTALSKPA